MRGLSELEYTLQLNAGGRADFTLHTVSGLDRIVSLPIDLPPSLVDAGIGLIVCITEAIPTLEMLRIVPLVMRTVAAELRAAGEMPAPAHFGLLTVLGPHPRTLTELALLQGVSLPTMSNSIANCPP
mgnify:CR=1 FL=1